MRVLSISIDSSILIKGSQSWNRQLLLSKRFDKYTVVVLGKGKEIKNGSLEVIPTNSGKIGFIWSAFRIASKIAADFDVITTQDPFETGLVGVFLKKKFGKALHVQVHGDTIFNKYWSKERIINRIRLAIGKYVLNKSDRIRVVSNRIKNRLIINGIDQSKIDNFPIFTDLARFRVPRKESPESALFVGRLSPEKNLFLLVDAWKKVVVELPNAKLTIVGDGPLRNKLEKYILNNKLSGNINLAGFKDPLDYYVKSQVLILPSLYEGWGLVVVEALASGTPVVMSDVGCASELVVNNKNSLVVRINEVEDLSTAIIKILKNKTLRDRLRKNGLKSVQSLKSETEIIKLSVKSFKGAIENYEIVNN